jgi:hypothetical protein
MYENRIMKPIKKEVKEVMEGGKFNQRSILYACMRILY